MFPKQARPRLSKSNDGTFPNSTAQGDRSSEGTAVGSSGRFPQLFLSGAPHRGSRLIPLLKPEMERTILSRASGLGLAQNASFRPPRSHPPPSGMTEPQASPSGLPLGGAAPRPTREPQKHSNSASRLRLLPYCLFSRFYLLNSPHWQLTAEQGASPPHPRPPFPPDANKDLVWLLPSAQG